MINFTTEICRTHFLLDSELEWKSLMFELPFAPAHTLRAYIPCLENLSGSHMGPRYKAPPQRPLGFDQKMETFVGLRNLKSSSSACWLK